MSVLVLAGCGGSRQTGGFGFTIYPADYRYTPKSEMTGALTGSTASPLRVLIPRNWHETADPERAPQVLAWLVSDDNSAAILFTRLDMDPALYQTLGKEGLMSVGLLSLSMKKDNAKENVTTVAGPEVFTLQNRKYVAYEYRVGNERCVNRIVVFDTGKFFVECVATAIDPEAPPPSRELFEVQQTLLSTLRLP